MIVLLGCMHHLDWRLPENTVQVLSTLVLLSYSKLLRTIITALVPATINIYSYNVNGTMNNSTSTVWKFDGEIQYGQLPHSILLSVALLALIFLFIPYTFIRFSSNIQEDEDLCRNWCPSLKPTLDKLTPWTTNSGLVFSFLYNVSYCSI